MAAWELVREHGLAGLSMRDLGERGGMRAQSVYSYFASKHEIYDAMFLEGYEAFGRWMDAAASDERSPREPHESARRAAHAFVEFCTTDPVRYQLLFQRTIPGFTPSPDSWSVALGVYEQLREGLSSVGARDQSTLDLWTAVLTGLTDQQISNDPGGRRWTQLIDRAVDMVFAETTTSTTADNTHDNESENER